MLKAVRHTAETLVILMVNAAILIPLFGYMAMDFSQQTDVAWIINDKGEKQGMSYKYPDSVGECAHRFYQLIHSPVEPDHWIVIALCLLTTIILIFVSYFVINKRDDDDTFVDLAIKTILVQLLLIVICLVGFGLNNVYLNPADALRQSIADQELAEKVIVNYKFWVYFGSSVVPLIIFAFFDTASIVSGAVVVGGSEVLLEKLSARARQIGSENREIIDGQIIVVHRNRVTEYLSLQWSTRWIPWPVAVLKKERFSVTSLDAFINEIANEARRFVTGSFLSDFRGTAQNCLRGLNPHLVAAFAQTWQNQLLRWTQANIIQIKKKLAARPGSSAEQLLVQTSLETASRIKQEMSATTAEMVRRQLAGFWGELMGQLRPIIVQNQTGLGNITPILPEGTKIFLAQDDTTLIVVEQKPQIRSVLFSGGFINRFGGLGTVDDRPDERFILAFPYVLFILIFTDSRFYRNYLFYRNQPLGSIEDIVFSPNLPNISGDNRVCLGHIPNSSGGLAEQTEMVIASFWDSQFNSDLALNFVGIGQMEPRLATLKRWADSTNQDPSFVFSVEWQGSGSLKQLFQNCLQGVVPVDVLRELDQITKRSISETTNSLGDQVSGRIAGMDFSGLCNRAAAQVLDQELNEINRCLVDVILTDADQVLASGGEKAAQELTEAITRAIPEALSNNLGTRIASGEFSSHVDIWDTMLRLVPREETTNDERAADTDIHSQAR